MRRVARASVTVCFSSSLPRTPGINLPLNITLLSRKAACLASVYLLAPVAVRCHDARRWGCQRWRSAHTVGVSATVLGYLARTKAEYDRIALAATTSESVSADTDSSRRLQRLTPLIRLIEEYEKKKQTLAEADAAAVEGYTKECDAELRQLMTEEIEVLRGEVRDVEARLLHAVLPPECADHCGTVVEVTAAVGGQEAMLFAHELFTMYQRYSTYKGWDFQLLEFDDSAELSNGLKKGIALISGTDVYLHLKFEGGVHRVQRVPMTEKAGRVHTSTATVSVLPQPGDIDIVLDPKHLRIDTFRSSGKGGQHVNKTESAVRITHLPTGVVVECQRERSQVQNRAVAMQVLRSRLFDAQLNKQTTAYNRERRLQVGSSSRSEKIRTYNFGQDRVTDHRVKETMHGVEQFLAGSEELDAFIVRLQEASRLERLHEVLHQAAHAGNAA